MLFGKRKPDRYDNGKIIVVKGSGYKKDEGYDRLRDNILYLNADGTKKVIQVESAVASEGKTTTLCNLAVSLGASGKKVVVVDLDFRRPRTHRVFELSKENGIAEYILEGKTKEEIIKKTKYENVDLITRGAEVYNSSLVFISEKFKNFIADLRNEYDFVLLDCAPVLLVSDYIHISEVSDGILFMVAHGITTKSQVSEAVKELNKNNAEILGAVFTMYDRKRTKYYNGYSYKKYYKYSYSAYVRDDDEDEQTENTQVQESKAKE